MLQRPKGKSFWKILSPLDDLQILTDIIICNGINQPWKWITAQRYFLLFLFICFYFSCTVFLFTAGHRKYFTWETAFKKTDRLLMKC